MESHFSFLLPIFFIFSFLTFLWLVKPKNKTKNEIPGPWKLPVLGNLHQLAAAKSTLAHHALRELSLKYGPVISIQLGEISTVIVSSPDIAKQIMKTHDLSFVQRPHASSVKIFAYGGTDIAFAPYGDYWRQMRKVCVLELLSAKKVQSFSYVRQDEVSKLIESVQLSIGSVFDLTSKIYSLTSSIVMRVAFGDKHKDQEQPVQLLRAALEQLSGFQFADLFPSMKLIHLITGMEAKLMKVHKNIDKFFDGIIKENQHKMMTSKGDQKSDALEEENLVQVLLRIQQSESLDVPITTDNIKAVIWDMFGGGTDTSATVLEWAMSEMMKNPKVMKKAQVEVRNVLKGKRVIHESDMIQLNYLKSVIKETLRLHPPVPLLIPRECRETCKINDYEIPIKTRIITNAWAIGRDPNYWYDAERFIPERFQGNNNSDIDFRGTNFEYIPFGAGRRMCPGITFGLASIELPLASLLYHFDWELPNGMEPHDLDMTEDLCVTARRRNHLCLIPSPFNI